MTSPLLDELERVQASEVKQRGWRGLQERIWASEVGAVLVRNHSRPEGVLMTVDAYERLRKAAQEGPRAGDRVDTLADAFAERLAALRTPQGNALLREALQSPLDFGDEGAPTASA